jgi:hypothetical protein
VILNLPGAATSEGRAALAAGVIDGLRYTIRCEGPGGTKETTVEGGGTVSIGLAAGHWHITVDAEYRNIPAGRGEGDVEVRAGASNTADIRMSPTEEFASPVITGEPRDAVLLRFIDGLASLEVQAVSFFEGALSYQWYSNTADSNAGGTAVAGGTGPVYTPPSTAPDPTYYYVEITGADNRVRASEAVEVRVIDPDSLTIVNAKTAGGGAYGIGEPFQYKVMTNSGGNAYDITTQVKPSDLNYNFGSAGTSISVSIAAASPFSGISWSPVTVEVKSLTQRVAEANTAGGSHTLLVYDDETMPGVSTASSTDANIINADITLKSSDETAGGMRTLALDTDLLASKGAMFYVSGAGVKLSLDRNITLNGSGINNTALVWVESSGALVMGADSVITGNTNTTGIGGGVYVDGGIFTMGGSASVSNNTTVGAGGGVYQFGGSFTVSGGTISGNTATGSNNGGGVYIVGSSFTFTKNGGLIYGDSDNIHTPGSTENTTVSGSGHAVYVSGSLVKKRDGTAGPADNLFTQRTGGATPSYSGGWDP